jgi:uncharacterized membrane protein
MEATARRERKQECHVITHSQYTSSSRSLVAVVAHHGGHWKGKIYISLFYVQGCVYKAYKSKIHDTEDVVYATVVR